MFVGFADLLVFVHYQDLSVQDHHVCQLRMIGLGERPINIPAGSPLIVTQYKAGGQSQPHNIFYDLELCSYSAP